MKRRIILHECVFSGRELVTSKKAGPPMEINVEGIDESIAATKKLLKERKIDYKTISLRADGDIQAIVWRDGAPKNSNKIPGWIWPRPGKQPA